MGLASGEKTKAAIVLTDNHPVNYLSDNISVGAVWRAINCIVKVLLRQGGLKREASPLFFVFGIMPVYDRQYNMAKYGRFDSEWEAGIVYLTSFLFPTCCLYFVPVWEKRRETRCGWKMQLAGCLANKMPIMLASTADLCLPLTLSMITF